MDTTVLASSFFLTCFLRLVRVDGDDDSHDGALTLQREKSWPRPTWACSSRLCCNSGTNFVRCCVAPLSSSRTTYTNRCARLVGLTLCSIPGRLDATRSANPRPGPARARIARDAEHKTGFRATHSRSRYTRAAAAAATPKRGCSELRKKTQDPISPPRPRGRGCS